MSKSITEEDFQRGVVAFQESYHGNEEYGISYEDAEEGMIVGLRAMGLWDAGAERWAQAARRRKAREDARERREVAAREKARRDDLTPEQRESEDRIRALTMNMLSANVVSTRVIDQLFPSNPMWKSIREKVSLDGGSPDGE